MRTRNQSKLKNHPIGEEEEAMKPLHQSGSQRGSLEEANEGTVTDISREAVGKLLKRVKKRSSRGLAKEDSNLRQCNSTGKLDSGPSGIVKQVIGAGTQDITEPECCRDDVITNSLEFMKVEGKGSHHAQHDGDDEMDDSYWEDGSISNLNSTSNRGDDIIKGVTIEFDASPDLAKRKPVRRATAEDKEVAELVHKVHLLCLLGRGRLIDSACNDPLIQASLLSLLPSNLLKIADVQKLTAKALAPLVSWFHNNFRSRNPGGNERSFHSALAFALETHEGTPEEVAALSVALFRALNLTTRFVSILDVASLKPDADNSEFISQDASEARKGIFNSSTLMVARQHLASASPVKDSAPDDKDSVCETSFRGSCISKFAKSTKTSSQLRNSAVSGNGRDAVPNSLAFESQNDKADMCPTKETEGLKRKGDFEFEMQLEMALSATALESTQTESNMGSDMDLTSNSSNLSPLRKMKKLRSEDSSSHGISTAFGSRKVGAPLYWAEVYCGGENLTGKWVHVDAINAIVDGEHKVETAAAACKSTLRYVVAFAGHGAKDVTRRYCMKWYKIASQRINSMWWEAVLAPLKGLESRATGGMVQLKQEISKEDEKGEMFKSTVGVSKEYGGNKVAELSMRTSFIASRSSLEDMELETRALTEPLPTNQQAYRNHQLYAIERWLTKYQILYPKGPVLGFCSGHPVYLRTCVQTLHTKVRWLREGMQVKANELPAKVLNCSSKLKKQTHEACDSGEESCEGTVVLYGKWQTEPLCLPPAVDGIVPKNERGQVDVWSEKCLPPGTVHLRLPRVASVAKRLEIDFAPAMVGFEFRNGKSVPVFDGIVVCAEFKDVILEAYAEEEDLRQAEEKRRNEAQALSRWYQLLSSFVTRQKLNEWYGNGESSQASISIQKADNDSSVQADRIGSQNQSSGHEKRSKHANKPDSLSSVPMGEHEHVFLTDDTTFDEENLIQTKRCHCGFSVQVEEL